MWTLSWSWCLKIVFQNQAPNCMPSLCQWKNLPKRNKNALDFQFFPSKSSSFSNIDKFRLWNKRLLPKKTRSWWFKVPFSSPSWRSQTPLEFGSLSDPNKVTVWITRIKKHPKRRRPIFCFRSQFRSKFSKPPFDIFVFDAPRVDAGQLRESDCIPTEWLSRRPQIWRANMEKWSSDSWSPPRDPRWVTFS